MANYGFQINILIKTGSRQGIRTLGATIPDVVRNLHAAGGSRCASRVPVHFEVHRWTGLGGQLLTVQGNRVQAKAGKFGGRSVVNSELLLRVAEWNVPGPGPVLVARHGLEGAHGLHSCRVQFRVEQLVWRVGQTQLHR